MMQSPDVFTPVDLGDVQSALLDGLLRFREAVGYVVAQIPAGRVIGYGGVAAALGSPRAARQVGYALAALPADTALPWWRVIRSDGSVALAGDPNRGPLQIAALREEGVIIVEGRVDMGRFGWAP
jgi:methylated-DNA-protein-cysteine methyltransferase-like protein